MATLIMARSPFLHGFGHAQLTARVLFKQRNGKAAQTSRKPFGSCTTRLSWSMRNPRAQQQASSYTSQSSPPPRRPFGSASSTLIVGSVIAGCVGLYGYEQIQKTEIKNGSRQAYAALQGMRKHFVLSLDNVRKGRYYVMLTSTFAHANGTHLLFNMLALWGFGTSLVKMYGVRPFAVIWFGSSLIGSALQLEYWKKVERPGVTYGAVGASGAVFGIMAALSVVYPQMGMYLVVIPMSIRTGMIISVALSLGAINRGWLPWLGHVDHLGGMTFGFVYAILALRRGRLKSPF